MSKLVVATNIRLPIKLHRELKKLAEQDNRSLHNYMITVLEKHTEQSK
jgi:predicted DNA-binding protein